MAAEFVEHLMRQFNMATIRLAVRGVKNIISNSFNISGNSRWSAQTASTCLGQRNMSAASSEAKPEAAADPPGDVTENEKKLRLTIDNLTKESATLTEKNEELDNKYKRALADGENMRKRLTKQIEDAKIFGIQGFCKDLLEVADILGKATESVPKEEVTDSNPHLKSLYEGLMMTDYELQKVFKRHGLVVVSPLNEKFNPNLHEALFQQEVQGKEPGTVVVVSKIGYKLHERVIRPALVGVAKGP